MPEQLHGFITANRAEIIARCRVTGAARSIPPPSPAEIDHGVPLFLEQLVEALRTGSIINPQMDRSAGEHGYDLLKQGFTLSQVVHDYGDVCQTITTLAAETDSVISLEDFRSLNRCLDEAIAGAVTMYARESQRMASVRHTEETGRSAERLGFVVHELRNLVNTAIVSFEVLKTGNVGVSGATGAILKRSLDALRGLVAQSLDDVRMARGTVHPVRLSLGGFIRNVEHSARLDADARGIPLLVPPVDSDLAIDADPQVLAAVVGNLIQNALKFTNPGTTVTLRARGSADRVLIEVEDECGGLPGGGGAELSATFEQRGADRSGLGIGLSFSRWGAEANGGRLYARNRPEKGCVFTVDLPRSVPN